ncbi:MAG: hypothetical protein LC122_06035 [Chitinophagales bacterium]|nr:hypothetical protein [Chitinophagales bacterium]
MKKALILLSATAIVFSSCKKDGGSSTPETYLPTTVGTNWKYKVQNGGTAGPDVTYTMSSLTNNINGNSYNVATAAPNPPYGNRNFRQDGNDYWTTISVSPTTYLELKILKADANVNDTWTTTQTLTGLTLPIPGVTTATVTVNYKMTQKGGTYTYSGVTYNDVIKVDITSISAAVAVPGVPPLSIGTANFIFAKNIGLLKLASNLSNATLSLNQNDSYDLIAYEIK